MLIKIVWEERSQNNRDATEFIPSVVRIGLLLYYAHCEQHSALNGRKSLLAYCSKFSLQTTLIQNTQLIDDIEQRKRSQDHLLHGR
jgi:hypothetical protein